MTRIGDLLDRDLRRPVEETVKVSNDDPETVFAELTEYVATERIAAEYERLLQAIAAAPKSTDEAVGIWISGFFGSGKSSFAKNLGYVLSNRVVRGTPASSLFLNRIESSRLAASVAFLNREVPCEIFPVEADAADRIVGVMYRALLRGLGYAEDCDIAEIEIELEKEGQLTAFEDLCRAEFRHDWRDIRNGSQALARASALLHRFDSRIYNSTDTWLNKLQTRHRAEPSVADLVEKSFTLCGLRRPGRTFAFIVDDIDNYLAPGRERLENLCSLVEQFGAAGIARMQAGKIPGPVWIVVTARKTLPEVCGQPAPELFFPHRIDLADAGIAEAVLRRVLRKKKDREPVLRNLFRERGAALIQHVRLESCSRSTACDEDQFVSFYPYLPHLIQLSIDILAGIQLRPDSSKYGDSWNRTIVRQCFAMLVSERTRLAARPIGALATIDRIYDLVDGNTAWEKQENILDIRHRFDDDPDYPGMASRAAKAICLMEFAGPGLPCTTRNIAALLIERVTEAPPVNAVAAVIERLEAAGFVRQAEGGWKLYDLDELRTAAAALGWLANAVGTVNPRAAGWGNTWVQRGKKLMARSLGWYTRPLREFNSSVRKSLDGVVGALDRLCRNRVALVRASIESTDRVSMDIHGLEERLRQSERRNAILLESMQNQLDLLRELLKAVPGSPNVANPETPAGACGGRSLDTGRVRERTVYVIGLFGTGRRYINGLMLQNIGERAKYFRDTIRLHPGPTPMIYSGHATMKYVSREQESPAVMSRILEAVGWGFADSIFIYRHPLDSLLTNWIWWRSYLRDGASISGISEAYRNRDDLCADLHQNFRDFQAFAKGDPDFLAGEQGPGFLSFPEFVEETELHLQSATLALRLEDFMVDPVREFSKIAAAISVDLDLSGTRLAFPRTTPYGHLALKDKVPEFRKFIDELDAETKKRIEKIGYSSG